MQESFHKPNPSLFFSSRSLRANILDGLDNFIVFADFGPNYYDKGLDADAKKLLKLIDHLIGQETPGTDNYATAILIKAYIYKYMSISLPSEERIAMHKKILILLEPYKCHRIGVHLFVQSLAMISEILANDGKFGPALYYVKEALAAFNDFLTYRRDKPMRFKDLINNRVLAYHLEKDCLLARIGYTYWRALEPKSITEKADWIIPALRRLIINPIGCCGGMPNESNRMIGEIPIVILGLLKLNRLKQLDRALAVAMNFLVQCRRHMCETALDELGAREALVRAQGCLSAIYVGWAIKILRMSLDRCQGRPQRWDLDNETFETVHQPDYHGYQTYTKQFPVEAVGSKFEMQKIVKRAKAWKKRALELFTDHEFTELTTMMDKLDEVSAEIAGLSD